VASAQATVATRDLQPATGAEISARPGSVYAEFDDLTAMLPISTTPGTASKRHGTIEAVLVTILIFVFILICRLFFETHWSDQIIFFNRDTR
jgi:hypothetical protein